MRKASSDDVYRLVAMMAEFYAEAAYPLNHRRAAEAFAAILVDERLGHVWFIQADSQDVGHVVVTFCYRRACNAQFRRLDDASVAGGHAGNPRSGVDEANMPDPASIVSVPVIGGG